MCDSASLDQQKQKDIKLEEFIAKHKERILQWRKNNGNRPTPVTWDGHEYKWLNRKQRRA